ncbi:dockerin type I domain-containing protein [Cohnella suwonensis]|uniref:Dockerin type I domain-containing protein n=1 Tax=Cohnella suwonensis TaxID=696072 RepID=A0ABW0LST3_9BACL
MKRKLLSSSDKKIALGVLLAVVVVIQLMIGNNRALAASGWSMVDGGGTSGLNADPSWSAYSSSLIVFDNALYAAWLENNGNGNQVQVKKYDGTVWTSTGGGLNVDSTKNATMPNLSVFKNSLYVAWSEFNGTAYQVRIKKYDGTSWTSADGGSGLNADSSKKAENLNLAVFNNDLYAAWNETNGTVNQIRVKKYDGTSWTSADGGSGLNADSSKNALDVKQFVFNNALYAVWREHNGTIYQIRVKKYDGASWTNADGGSALNVVSANGAQNPTLIVYNNALHAAWEEHNGASFQIRVKKYDGTSWTSADGGGTSGLNVDSSIAASSPNLAVFNNALYAAWYENNGSADQIRVKKYDGTSWTSADGNGISGLNLSSSQYATFPNLYAFNNALFAVWSEQNGNAYQLRAAMLPGSTAADETNNSVSASPASVEAGGSVTLTAAGDRQSAIGAVSGDERYIPASWTSTESGKTGTYSLNGSNYESTYTTTVAGSYTVTVTFTKQTWNGSVWTDTSITDEKTAGVNVKKPIVKGDGNGDGVLSPADALMISKYVKGKMTLTDEQKQALDMDADGDVDAADAKLILEIYSGK